MSSTQSENARELTIVGGGITGMTSAYLAAKSGIKVRLIEAGNQLGGLLHTFPIAGNRLEFYYHHFFTHDAEVNWLMKELGLTDELFFKKTSMGVFRNGTIYDFNSPRDLLKFSPINFLDKVKFALTSLYLGKYANWKNSENIGAMEWFRKWAGQGTCESLWEPLLEIKFGPFAEKVPLSWMIGRLRQRMSSRKGSAEEQLGYIKGSLQKLSDKLEERLRDYGVDVITNGKVNKAIFEDGKITSLETNAGTFLTDRILFTIPTIRLHPLFQEAYSDYAEQLKRIQYFGAVCVVIEMEKAFSDIYWMNVADPDYPFGGIIEHTNFIPPEEYSNSHILYLSRYFAHNEPVANMSKDEIQELMLPHLKRINSSFDETTIKSVHVFKTMTAATVCDLNFSETVPDCKTPVPNVFLANMAHVYPDERSVNNSIRIAAEACRVMGIPTGQVSKNLSLSGQIGM